MDHRHLEYFAKTNLLTGIRLRAKFILRVIATLGLLSSAPLSAAELIGTAKVIDGDTLEIQGQRIRLHGIDAPESRQYCLARNTEYPCGAMATSWVTGLTFGHETRCEGDKKGRYGRLLGVCFIDGKNLNSEIVRAGWALAYTRYSRDYLEVQAIAARNRQGIWAGKFTPPWEWRRRKRARR